MAKVAAKELLAFIEGLAIRDADQVVDYNLGMLFIISRWVAGDRCSEKEFPAEFARLRQILHDAKHWYMAQAEFMRLYHEYRQDYPRSFWWWWMAEL